VHDQKFGGEPFASCPNKLVEVPVVEQLPPESTVPLGHDGASTVDMPVAPLELAGVDAQLNEA
jgi:hypothetical protein